MGTERTSAEETRAAVLALIKAREEGSFAETLDGRKREELTHSDKVHDESARAKTDTKEYQQQFGNLKFYRGAARVRRHIADWIATNAKDRVVLDFACGLGMQAIDSALAGARLAIGVDLSPLSIATARERAREAGLSEEQVLFYQGDGESTRLPDKSIDAIICSGVLHHVDLSYTLPELRRILAPGGKILVIEPLNYNLAIRMYRKMTPQIRTEWEAEHILTMRDVTFMRRFFNIADLRFWCMLSPLSAYCPPAFGLLDGLDKLLTRIPLVQLWSWQFTAELELPGE